jgi:hypothetical protein
MAITSANTRGPVNNLLKESRLGSKEENLDKTTVVENFERKFIRSKGTKDVDDQLCNQILQAFQDYLKTVPDNKIEPSSSYKVNIYSIS